jgi:hypothetical protein
MPPIIIHYTQTVWKQELSSVQIRHSGRVRGGRLLPGLLGDGTRSDKERTSGLWDNSYRFPGMEIAIEEGGIDEELRAEKLLLSIPVWAAF